jgi:hypothetical protein
VIGTPLLERAERGLDIRSKDRVLKIEMKIYARCGQWSCGGHLIL